MNDTKTPTAPVTRTPAPRGAARPGRDGIARITVSLHLRLSATELTRALIAAPARLDLSELDPVEVRAAITGALAEHGYDAVTRTTFDGDDERHQEARRAVRRAYGRRFTGHPDEQAFLAEPLLYTVRTDLCGDQW